MIEEIGHMLAEKLELKDFDLQYTLPSFGGYDLVSSKVHIILTSSGNKHDFFLKLANSPALSSILLHEADSIVFLFERGIERIPKITLHGSFSGRYFIVEQYVKGKRMHSAPQYLSYAYERTRGWLQRLYERTLSSSTTPSELLKRAEQHISKCSGVVNLSDSLSSLQGLSVEEEIPLCTIHGDFWHGNMIVDEHGMVTLTDFAMCSKDEPPVDYIDLVSDYNPSVLLDSSKLSIYRHSLLSEHNQFFLIVYQLIRKISLKVQARLKLYDELLLEDIYDSLTEIRELAVLKYVLDNLERH